jgi:hypothetical protein
LPPTFCRLLQRHRTRANLRRTVPRNLASIRKEQPERKEEPRKEELRKEELRKEELRKEELRKEELLFAQGGQRRSLQTTGRLPYPDLKARLPNSEMPFKLPCPRLADIKDTLSAIQSLATIAALLAGAWWFYRQNQDAPRLKIEHIIATHQEASGTRQILVSVEVKASNTGNTPVSVPKGTIRLVSISPATEILDDSNMEDVDLQPGESDQIYFHVYRIAKQIGTIQVETHVPEPKGDGDWETNSVFDVKPGVKGYAVTENSSKK